MARAVATGDPPRAASGEDRLEVLIAELAIAREAWELAERRAAHAEARLRTALAFAQEQAGVGYRVEKVISLANLQAAGIRTQAEADAAAIREDARAAAAIEAERTVTAAQQEAAAQREIERNRSGPDHPPGGEGPASIAARAAGEEPNRSGPDHRHGPDQPGEGR